MNVCLLPATLCHLHLEGLKVLQDVSAISNLRNLQYLTLRSLPNLTLLTDMTNSQSLTHLTISRCPKFSTLKRDQSLSMASSFLEPLHELEYLNVSETNASSADFHSLWLRLSYSNSVLPTLISTLLCLDLSCCPITNVSSLAHFTALKSLNLSYCTQIVSLRELVVEHLDGKQIGLASLESLSLRGLRRLDVSALVNIPALTTLDLRDCFQVSQHHHHYRPSPKPSLLSTTSPSPALPTDRGPARFKKSFMFNSFGTL